MPLAVLWRTGALGDLVLTQPIAAAMRARAQRLWVVAPRRIAPLWPDADRWIDADGPEVTALFAGRLPIAAQVGVAWTSGAADALITAGVAHVLAGTPHPPPGVHQLDALWRPVAPWLGPRDRDPRIAVSEADRAAAVARFGHPIAIAPGSGGAAKRIPIDTWRRVADAAPGPVLWVGGPIEAGEPDWGSPRVDDLDPVGLAALASVCTAWLGPDAGPQHVAAAAGARVGVVFTAATDPRQWAPPGATVFRAGDGADPIVRWLRS